MALAVVGCATTTKPTTLVIPTTSAPVVAPALTHRAAPTAIQIPAIRVDAPLVPLGLDKNKAIMVPDLNHVDEASWYCEGYRPTGDTQTCAGGVIPGDVGPAAIYGHIDGHKRDGVFRHLPELHVGDAVNIQTSAGSTLVFKVYKVQTVHKRDFSSLAVYGNVNRPELRLITCTGVFVGGAIGYEDQGIIYASLAA